MKDVIYSPKDGRKLVPTAHGDHIMKSVIYETKRGIPGPIPGVTQKAVASLGLGMSSPERHKHPTMWECYICIDGEAIYYVGDKEYPLRAGDFIAIPPNTLHVQKVTKAPHTIFYYGIEDNDDTSNPGMY